MQDKYSPVIPQIIPAMERPSVSPATLGYYELDNHRGETLAIVNGGQYEERVAIAEQLLDEKQRPEQVGKVRRVVGKLVGSVMSDEEGKLVDSLDQMREEVKEHERLVKVYGSLQRTDLESARMKIEAYDEGQAETLDNFCEDAVPEFFKYVKESVAGEETSWQSWLAKEASDEQLVNFFEWNVHHTEQQQMDAEAQYEIDRERTDYKEGIRRGVEEGRFHPDALDAIEAVDDAVIFTGDVFDTLILNRGGYHTRTQGYIVISGAPTRAAPGGLGEYIFHIKRAAKHELNHIIFPKFGHRWLDEALTEHIAHSINYGSPEALHPKDRPYYTRPVYTQERMLLDYLLRNGQEQIPLELATRAYTEHPDSNEAKDALKQAIDRAWGHIAPEGTPVLAKLSQMIESRENRYIMREGMNPSEAGNKAVSEIFEELKERPNMLFSDERDSEQIANFSFSPKPKVE